jgi:cystathionine beta-lyase/cystathionine gamma-synthase
VHYLGLDTHPDHALATASFSGYGNLMLLTMRDGEPAARTLLDRLRQFGTCDAEQASRIGGTTSVASALPGGSVRLNIGLDDAASLIHDLTQALE